MCCVCCMEHKYHVSYISEMSISHMLFRGVHNKKDYERAFNVRSIFVTCIFMCVCVLKMLK